MPRKRLPDRRRGADASIPRPAVLVLLHKISRISAILKMPFPKFGRDFFSIFENKGQIFFMSVMQISGQGRIYGVCEIGVPKGRVGGLSGRQACALRLAM